MCRDPPTENSPTALLSHSAETWEGLAILIARHGSRSGWGKEVMGGVGSISSPLLIGEGEVLHQPHPTCEAEPVMAHFPKSRALTRVVKTR